MSGPNYPVAKDFEMAGWRIFAVDLLFGEEHDLSKLDNQERIRLQLKHADFIWAALDCSDKTRIREIRREHADGRAMPSPLRSVEHLWDCRNSRAMTKREWQQVMQPLNLFLES